MQADAPIGLNKPTCPIGQGTHVVELDAPVVFENVPAAHAAHTLTPLVLE